MVEGGQNAPVIKDKLPSENNEQDIDVRPGQETKKYSTNREKRRTISINTVPAKGAVTMTLLSVDGSLLQTSYVTPTRGVKLKLGWTRIVYQIELIFYIFIFIM